MRRSPLLALMVACLALPGVARAQVIISAGKAEGAAGGEVTVPISFKNVKDTKGISCLSLRLTFDSDMLTFKEVKKGAALPDALVSKEAGEGTPGKVGIGFVCAVKAGGKEMGSVEEDGVVMEVVFSVNAGAAQGQKSPVKLDIHRVLDYRDPPYELAATTEAGEVTVTGGGLASNLLLWIGIGAGAFVLLLILMLVLLRRRRPAETYSRPGAMPASYPSAGSSFPHRCLQCGGVINLPENIRGQRFQCAACGTAQVAGS